MKPANADEEIAATSVPRLSYGALFLKFLRFGSLAWGGPVAQLAMLKRELVEEERWVSVGRFNRALAVYQVLPGPEAHEMCVYFGMLARGRVGAVLAGLGFMLPGLLLMLGLSWLYVTYGIRDGRVVAALAGLQAAVVALVVWATYRIGRHTVTNPALWGIAIGAFVAAVLGIHFAVPLLAGALVHPLAVTGRKKWAVAVGTTVAGVCVASWLGERSGTLATAVVTTAHGAPDTLAILGYGLRAGLMTFGGAYTAIPFLQHDAVVAGNWMTDDQFLDGVGLSGVLPAPLIIFSTFVGFLGGGWLGAIAMTIGVFLPAFGFTLLGHDFFERITGSPRMRATLDGVAAAVVGLIAATAISLFRAGASSVPGLLVFLVALGVLYVWNSKAATPVVILGSGAVGLLLFL